jgi:alkyldihydroxyacetonephosphate synthase
LVSWANKGLGYMGFGPQRVMLVLGITGSDQAASHALRQAKAILKSWKAINTGTFIGRTWQKGRFLTPYLRNTLWDAGYAVDTLETAVSWSEVLTTSSGIKSALKKEMEKINQRLYVFSHLSHVYRDGGSVYVTFLFQRCQDPVELLQRWRVLKKTASEIIQSHGGTISHQHGIGIDHQIYLPREKGSVGINLIAGAIGQMDPQGIMNPGKLL